MPVLPFHFPVPLFKIIPLQEKIHPGLTATENRRALSRYRRIGTIIDGPHKKFAPPGGFFPNRFTVAAYYPNSWKYGVVLEKDLLWRPFFRVGRSSGILFEKLIVQIRGKGR
jgi:hypothetical protein